MNMAKSKTFREKTGTKIIVTKKLLTYKNFYNCSPVNEDKLRDLSMEGFKRLERDCKTFEGKAQNLIQKHSGNEILKGMS